MAATNTYRAQTPFGGSIITIDPVAVAAKKLAGFANEMEGVRDAFPDNDVATAWNEQMRQLGSLFQALVDEIEQDAERHGLKPDPAGDWISAAGFEIQEMRVGS
jgi:hypothetical protein